MFQVSYEWQRKNNSEPGILNAIEMFSVPPTDNLFGSRYFIERLKNAMNRIFVIIIYLFFFSFAQKL